MNHYINTSLELHLFFARIMKEHSLFLEAGFVPKDTAFIQRATWLREQFESFLCRVVSISNAMVCNDVLASGEVTTEFTLDAEKKTQQLTGIPIDSNITLAELRLSGIRCGGSCCGCSDCGCSGCECCSSGPQYTGLEHTVWELNCLALELLNQLISFKEAVLDAVLECRLFTVNYPLLIEHIIREAKLYRSYVTELIQCGTINPENMRSVEMFWNQIMMEHAMFIRGLLDPAEAGLVDTADDFAKNYARLLEASRNANDQAMGCLTEKTIEETLKYRDFKAAGAQGLVQCDIRSIILPLLADHVLREANHYLRILKPEGSY